MKKLINKEKELQNILIERLIHNIMGLFKSDPNFKIINDFINNFLRNNSLMYIPKISEIKENITGLQNKFIINSQFEKSKIISDYILRLETIFNSKSANIDYLYKFILIIIQLARSPLMNVVDVDLLKERFEERYIRLDEKRIIKNKKFELKNIKIITTVEFEPVNYNSESSEYENSDECLNISLEEENNNKKIQNEDVKNLQNIDKNKNFFLHKLENYGKIKKFDVNYKFDLLNLILKNTKYSSLFDVETLNFRNNESFSEDKIFKNENEKIYFFNSLKLENQINLNSRISLNKISDNSKKLYNFYLDKIEENDFKYKNSFAFTNIYKSENITKIKNKNENFIYIDSDNLLISLLNNLISWKEPLQNNIQTKNLEEIFKNIICLDLDKNLQNCIISDLEKISQKIFYLKNFDNLIKENNIISSVVNDLNHYIAEINKCFEFILISYLKLALFQKGKLNNPLEIFIKDKDYLFDNKNKDNTNFMSFFYSYIFDDKDNKNSEEINKKIYEKTNFENFSNNLKTILKKNKNEFYSSKNSNFNVFTRVVQEYHNYSMIKYIDYNYLQEKNFSINNLFSKDYDREFDKKKFTLLNFYNDIKNLYEEKIDYVILICENLIKIKLELDNINSYKPYLFLKELIDFIYLTTKKIVSYSNKFKVLLSTEILFVVIFSYLKIILEFIINGNLIDNNNEFFLDHIFTKGENSKVIFYFNEKFKNFDWFNSFKIKSYSLYEIEGGCVPEIFKIDSINFKILETGKSIFLIRNLKNLSKINFDMLINLESLELNQIKNLLNKEIYKIVEIEGILEYNYNFYEFFIQKKFKEDNFIRNSEIENENQYYDLKTSEKNKFLNNNLETLKKKILINSEIEFQLYKKLPFKMDSINLIDITEKMDIDENRNKIILNNTLEEKESGMNFNFNMNLNQNSKINNLCDSKKIFDEENNNSDTWEDLSDSDQYENNIQINSIKNHENQDKKIIHIDLENPNKNLEQNNSKNYDMDNKSEIIHYSNKLKEIPKIGDFKIKNNNKNSNFIIFSNLAEIQELKSILNTDFNTKDKVSIQSSFTGKDIYSLDNLNISNIDYIFKSEILRKLDLVNRTINKKLLNFLFNTEKIREHFELCFAINFFKAGFSMDIFVKNILDVYKFGFIGDNFYLKNLLIEISSNSDLKKYNFFIKEYFDISQNTDKVNNYDTFIVKYKPKLPISIFFDDNINKYYSAIFNFIFNVKRMKESFKTIE